MLLIRNTRERGNDDDDQEEIATADNCFVNASRPKCGELKRKEPDGEGVMLTTIEDGGGSIETISALWMSVSGSKGLWRRSDSY